MPLVQCVSDAQFACTLCVCDCEHVHMCGYVSIVCAMCVLCIQVFCVGSLQRPMPAASGTSLGSLCPWPRLHLWLWGCTCVTPGQSPRSLGSQELPVIKCPCDSEVPPSRNLWCVSVCVCVGPDTGVQDPASHPSSHLCFSQRHPSPEVELQPLPLYLSPFSSSLPSHFLSLISPIFLLLPLSLPFYTPQKRSGDMAMDCQ